MKCGEKRVYRTEIEKRDREELTKIQMYPEELVELQDNEAAEQENLRDFGNKTVKWKDYSVNER